MKYLIIGFVAGCALVCIQVRVDVNNLAKEVEKNRQEVIAQRNEFAAHYADSTNAFTKVCADVGTLRFTVKAIANSLKFVEVKR